MEEKIMRIEGKARVSMPPRAQIAEYWSGMAAFEKLDWEYPGCFACQYQNPSAEAAQTLEGAWERTKLQRCHLIPASEGGTREVSNLVLLCQRCHREAPMIGASAIPMLEWINRRESYWSWICGRALAECRAISPTLPEDLSALNLDAGELGTALTDAADVLRIGYHAGGDPFSTVAQCMYGALQSVRRMRAGGNGV